MADERDDNNYGSSTSSGASSSTSSGGDDPFNPTFDRRAVERGGKTEGADPNTAFAAEESQKPAPSEGRMVQLEHGMYHMANAISTIAESMKAFENRLSAVVSPTVGGPLAPGPSVVRPLPVPNVANPSPAVPPMALADAIQMSNPADILHPQIGDGAPIDRLHSLEQRIAAWEPAILEVVRVAAETAATGAPLSMLLRQLARQLGHIG